MSDKQQQHDIENFPALCREVAERIRNSDEYRRQQEEAVRQELAYSRFMDTMEAREGWL